MSMKTDSISNVKDTIKYEKKSFVSNEKPEKSLLFQSNNSRNLTDTVSITQKKYTAENGIKPPKKDEKKSNLKKWLIAGGVALGAIAIGIGAYYITKKSSTKVVKELSNKVVDNLPTKVVDNLPTKVVDDLPEKFAGDFLEKFKKIYDFDVFKNLKMCKNLSLDEKNNVFELLTVNNRKELFTSVLTGDKPMTIIACDRLGDDLRENSLELLKKLDLGENIQTFDSISRYSEQHRFWSKFFVNKSKVFDKIEQNKEIFLARLDLPKSTTTQQIYDKFFASVVKDGELYMHDLLGISLGYPKHDALLFQLDAIGNLFSKRMKEEYPDLLMDVLKGENSPYKNLSKETLKSIEDAILKFKSERGFTNRATRSISYNDMLFDFINYTNNVDEINKIKSTTENFLKKMEFDIDY